MIRKPDIQYIGQFYVPGSEAQVVEPKPAKKKRSRTSLPKARPQKKIRVLIDPGAWCGIVVSAVMLVLLVTGAFQYMGVCRRYQAVSGYVISLQNENVELKQTFEKGYDLDDIRTKALAIGMIPIEQAETIPISAELPQKEPEPSLWEEIVWFFEGLFA